MKKIVALVLALMMVLSLGVSALALTLTEIKLDQVEETEDGKKLIKFEKTVDILGTPGADKVLYTKGPHGGVAYFVLNTTGLKDVKATYSNDAVKAEIIDYDPEKMEYVDGADWAVVRKDGKAIDEWLNKIPAYDKDTQPDGLDGSKYVESGKGNYDWCKYVAKTLNKFFKTTQFVVKTTSEIKVLKLTVAANYSASFTEGSVKVSALKVADKKTYYTEMKIVNDITIFAYEYVKSAAEYKYALELFDTGYSDYETYVNGYKQADLAQRPGSRVISTTAFRAIEGKDITVNVCPTPKENDEKRVASSADVTIYNVAAGQKGVNFEYYEKEVKEATSTALAVDGENRKVEFGFYGDQVVKSKFTVNFNLDWTYFKLREFFGKKVEEQDIVTYYILKDGKVLKEVKVDYMTVDYNDTVKLSIDGENTTLGQYAIAVKVPAENKGEQNPNTGAESVMGVVAAVAVVSVAAAAAVSLKK